MQDYSDTHVTCMGCLGNGIPCGSVFFVFLSRSRMRTGSGDVSSCHGRGGVPGEWFRVAMMRSEVFHTIMDEGL